MVRRLAPSVFDWPGLRPAFFARFRCIPGSCLGCPRCSLQRVGAAVVSCLCTFLQQLYRDLLDRPAPIGRDKAPRKIRDAVTVFTGRALARRRAFETTFIARPFARASAGAEAGRGSKRRLWIMRRD